MTLSEAVRRGITKMRKGSWGFADAYLELTIVDISAGKRYLGPWGKLYSPQEQQILGVECPQQVLIVGDGDADWEEFSQPLTQEARDAHTAG